MADDFEINLGAEFERQLSMCPKVNAFKVPPLKQAEGYKCSGWEGQQLWSGRCRVLAKGTVARIVLDDPASGNVFAEAPLDNPNAVEAAVDSSRYFVLRVVSGTRHAFIGIGFNDRNEAFDFKTAIEESKKVIRDFASSQASAGSAPPPITSSGKDYSLHGGKISLDIAGAPGGGTRKRREVPAGAFQLKK
jgi:hypothetical protein